MRLEFVPQLMHLMILIYSELDTLLQNTHF